MGDNNAILSGTRIVDLTDDIAFKMSGTGLISGSTGSATAMPVNSDIQTQQILSYECSSKTNGTPTNNNSWNIFPIDPSKMSKIQEIVDDSVSLESKCIIDNILQEVAHLSDMDKLLLYLKLPTSCSQDVDPLKQPLNPLGSRNEIQLTITWIKTHLKTDMEVSLPKREVYDEYLKLSTADFGKVMKQVFPSVRPRRLGQRGASKYCYSGLRKRYTHTTPCLPDLSENKCNLGTYDQGMPTEEMEQAALQIILEWAEKLYNIKFESSLDLANHLLQKNYVDSRSLAANALLTVCNKSDGTKRRETQMQLQQKIQERERIKEQKRKLQEGNSSLCRSNSDRPKSRKKNVGLSRSISTDVSIINTRRNSSGLASQTVNSNSTISEDPLCVEDFSGPPVSSIKQEPPLNDFKTFKECDSGFSSDSKGNFNCEPLSTVSHNSQTYNLVNRNSLSDEKVAANSNIVNSDTSQRKTLILAQHTGCKVNSPKPKFKSIKPEIIEKSLATSNSSWIDKSVLEASVSIEVLPPVTSSSSSSSQNSLNEFDQQQIAPLFGHSGCINDSEEDLGYRSRSDLDNADQLLEIRKLLQKNLPGSHGRSSCPSLCEQPNSCGEIIDSENSEFTNRRRVSFQTSDGNENFHLLNPQLQGNIPSSPNTATKGYNFKPIGHQGESGNQGLSQCSSAATSPFMSPRNTPLPRSRHNSGQTSSSYATPRSTPFTPDGLPHHIVPSESSTPFMSPISTPLQSRSRHNSSQNSRGHFVPPCRSRHPSGAPLYRPSPYSSDDRRLNKFRSRHSSGSIPPSPLSAPLSPHIQDCSQLFCDSANAANPHTMFLHSNLLGGSKKTVSSDFRDIRRRHLSAGPAIHYQPQLNPVPTVTDSFSSNSNQIQSDPSGNRPQSVPLPQMMETSNSLIPDSAIYTKSHPSTPTVNQTFVFSSECGSSVSQTSSYAPTPVPSEFNDFDIDNMLINFSSVSAVTSEPLGNLDSLHTFNSTSASDLNMLGDATSIPPNVNPFTDGNLDLCLVHSSGSANLDLTRVDYSMQRPYTSTNASSSGLLSVDIQDAPSSHLEDDLQNFSYMDPVFSSTLDVGKQ